MNSSIELKRFSRKIEKNNERLYELKEEIQDLIDNSEEIKEDVVRIQSKLSENVYPGLNFISIRNALCAQKSIEDQNWLPGFIATTGNGPWNEEEFDNFLKNYGVDLFQIPDQDIDAVILGSNDWNEEALSEQIYDRTSKDLRIYTQELFVLGLIVGKDPYEFLEQDVIDEIGENHSAIKYILAREFLWPDWPSGDSEELDEIDDDAEVGSRFNDIDWAKESVLRTMGYSASASGPSSYERREILRKAFEEDFSLELVTYEQRDRWGPKKSADRLYAISHFLAWLSGFQGTDKPAAKLKWDSDLEWLKNKYFSKTMRFSWPTQTINTVAKPSSERKEWPVKVASPDLLRPSNALGRIIGGRSMSFSDAVREINDYIARLKLDFDGRSIRCDQALFAMTGRASLQRDELMDIVRKNLYA
jgi:hypothetical protein